MKRFRTYFSLMLLFFGAAALAQPAEVRLLTSLYGDSASTYSIAQGLSTSVVPASGAFPAGVLLAGLIKHDSVLIEKGMKASVACVFNGVLSTGMKYFFDRRRPFVTYPQLFSARSHVGPYSFPSGHTSFAFTTATSATLCFPKWYVAVPAYAWAAAAGWSRMRLGVHYPSDVLMGALVGTASAILTFKIDKLLNRKSTR